MTLVVKSSSYCSWAFAILPLCSVSLSLTSKYQQIKVSCAKGTCCNATVPVSFVLTLETGTYDSHPLHTMCCENYLYLCLKSSHLLNAHKPLPLVVILPKIVFVISNISTNSQYKWKSDPSQATFKLLTQPRLWKVEFFSVSRRQKIKKVLDTSSHLN